MKSRTSVRNRSRSNAPASITCNWGRCGSASVSPPIVRHGLNHSRPAVSVPIRASIPSEAMSTALKANRSESSALYVWICDQAVHTVAFSSAGFLSSIRPSGRPLTNNTISGRRSCSPSTTVNWLTASQSLFAGLS